MELNTFRKKWCSLPAHTNIDRVAMNCRWCSAHMIERAASAYLKISEIVDYSCLLGYFNNWSLTFHT